MSEGTKRQTAGKDAPFPLREQMDFKEIKFTTIFQSSQGLHQTKNGVIHSDGDLKVTLPFLPPDVKIDFSKEEVIFVALGERPTGGYKVEITAVTYLWDRLNKLPNLTDVTYHEDKPSNPIRNDIVTFPTHVVKCEKLDGDASFTKDGGIQ
ncbi:MAG TPA: protease complex subunit PrcB family protein [Candidatus Dormibacteraeota bacterium]|nr:protease complex subunit PrcB family protein [Candidatus Dormibacteraeota bacterium]